MKASELKLVLAHYQALPILIEYVKKMKSTGDRDAIRCLADWDAARRVDRPNA